MEAIATADTLTTKTSKAKAPKKPRAKKAPKPKKESKRTPALTEAQRDRFIAQYAKQQEVSDTEARKMILARGVQRLATLARWQDKQS